VTYVLKLVQTNLLKIDDFGKYLMEKMYTENIFFKIGKILISPFKKILRFNRCFSQI